MFGPCFVIYYFVSFSFFDNIGGDERAGCFALIVIMSYRYYYCSVALPHDAASWSALCECGIS